MGLRRQLVNRRNDLRQRYFDLFNSLGLDVILCPASPAPALPFHTTKYWSYTSLFNFLDWPAAVFPTGVSVDLEDKDEGYIPRNEDERRVYDSCESGLCCHH
jgi:Asp-tRNA(Asn)/Glu-tRNA(Gln) amidotransferase A subunit family amidase